MSIFRILTPTGRQLRRIEQAIKEENYALAERQLEVLKEMTCDEAPAMFRRKSEIARLEVEIGKQTQITTLRTAVDTYNLEDAQRTLKRLKEQNTLNKHEKSELEHLVDSITEEGMLQYMKSTTGTGSERQKGLLTKHRELYPDSKKRKQVVEDLTEHYFRRLTEGTIDHEELSEFYEKAKNLRRALDEQKEENLILTLPINKLIEDVKKYISENFLYAEDGGDVEVGNYIKVIDFDTENKSWFGSDYMTERFRNFPVGSIGRVINKIENEYSRNTNYLVEFENTGLTWGDQLSIQSTSPLYPYWKAGRKNIAIYTGNELEGVEIINPAERQKVIAELDKIQELYTQFYSKPTEPVKRRHNPEITEKDKVLPRSD